MQNNPYNQMVQDHDKIFTTPEELYAHKGKWKDFFNTGKDIRLEIGTGLGNFFALESKKENDKNFIGMELKFKRLYKTAEKTLNNGIEDFILLKDYGQHIPKIFDKGEIEQTYVFFPDPWPKERHAKHRLLQKGFLKDLHIITKSGGKLIYKTDHRVYFDSVIECIKEEGIWEIGKISYDYETEMKEEFSTKELTEFEVIFRNQDIKINYVELIKID